MRCRIFGKERGDGDDIRAPPPVPGGRPRGEPVPVDEGGTMFGGNTGRWLGVNIRWAPGGIPGTLNMADFPGIWPCMIKAGACCG